MLASESVPQIAKKTIRSTQTFGIKSFYPNVQPLSVINNSAANVSLGGEEHLSPIQQIYVNFEKLKQIQYKNLCKYVDIITGKHGRVFLVSEHFSLSLREYMTALSSSIASRNWSKWEEKFKGILFSILLALDKLSEHGIVHRNLNADTCLINSYGDVVLSDYVLYSITNMGSLVNFPIGEPMYFAPEVISSFNPTLQTTTGCCKSDIWAFGLMIIELVNGSKLWTNHLRNTNQIFSRLSSLFAFDCHKLSFNSQNSNGESPSKESLCELQSTISSKRIQSEFMSAAHWKSISADLVDVISQCLQLNPMERPSCIQLLYHPYFLPLLKTYHSNYLWAQKPFLRSMLLPDLSVENYPFDINQNDSLLEDHDEIANGNGSSNGVGDVRRNIQQLQNHNSAESLHSKFGDHHPEEIKKINSSPNVSRTKSLVNLNDQTIKDIKDNNFVEIYNFWKINGGNLLQLCKELEESPSTTRLPSFIFSSDFKTNAYSNEEDHCLLYNDNIYQIPIITMKKNLLELSKRPSSHVPDESEANYLETFHLMEYFGGINNFVIINDRKLPPREIRENDIDYQRYRMKLFNRLFQRLPASSRDILQEAKIDIPPLMRAEIWAVILDVHDQPPSVYDNIDKISPGHSDHQIDLDIPRCHQYHPLLSSAEGHQKMRRVLKAWAAANPSLVYWQGLDSLLAPFVTLNFQNESRAYHCLTAVVNKYLYNFFLKENSSFLQGHLVLFRQLLTYHDPELGYHLVEIGFHPELYAIPWFLTLFTHILNIEKIYRLWDMLLLQQMSFPLFLAVSLMRMLRDTLLTLDFQACILLFSNISNLSIEKCIDDAIALYEHTPLSMIVRKFLIGSEPPIPDPRRPWEKYLTLEQFRAELAGRITFSDVFSFSQPLVCVDIRSTEEFAQKNYPSSVNLSIFDATLNDFQQFHGKHIVLIGDRSDSTIKLANKLIQNKYPYISILHGGIESVISQTQK